MNGVVDSGRFPPPRTAGFVDALAVIAAGFAALAALLLVVSLGVLATGGPATRGGLIDTHPITALAATASSVSLFGLTAWGLWHRRMWAWWASVAELVSGTGLLGLSVVLLAHNHDQTDSSGMAAMSAVVCGFGLLAVLAVVLLPVTRRGFRLADSGWYRDPGGLRLRWWDGSRWTDHVSD